MALNTLNVTISETTVL